MAVTVSTILGVQFLRHQETTAIEYVEFLFQIISRRRRVFRSYTNGFSCRPYEIKNTYMESPVDALAVGF